MIILDTNVISEILKKDHADRRVIDGLRVKMCVWLGVSRGLDLAFLNAD